MKTTYVFDTNTISYLFRREGNVYIHSQDKIYSGDNFYAIPYVVVYETKRWLFDRPTKRKRIFAEEFNILFEEADGKADMTAAVWDKAAEIYIDLKQRGLLIGDMDILIAAYCVVNNYTLVTRNESDFTRVEGLKFVNWYG